MTAVLHVRPDGSSSRVADVLRKDGLEVIETIESRDAADRAAEAAVDAAVIDAGIGSPVVVARAIHRSRPDAHIVFVADDANEPQLRRELLFAPRIGTQWSVIREPLVQQTLRGVLSAKSRREQVKSALDRMNLRLAEAPLPPRR
ncbi:MAG: hypothetical protein WA208_07775, partial [Thermoanaerobaculia bacterium]